MQHDNMPNVSLDESVPDSILPEQYFDAVALRASDVPEKRLMFAVLLDAVTQLHRRNTAGAAEAERWIRGEDEDTDSPFSFTNVCEALAIDPGYLARGLLAWRHEIGGLPVSVPVRQLRRSTRRVTPLAQQRHRRAAARAAAAQSTGRYAASGGRVTSTKPVSPVVTIVIAHPSSVASQPSS